MRCFRASKAFSKKNEVVLCVRLNRGNISPAPLTEVGQADAYIKQLQVKCSSLCSETAKNFLGLWLKDNGGGGGGGGGWGFSLLCPPTRGRQVHKNAESADIWAFSATWDQTVLLHRTSCLAVKAKVSKCAHLKCTHEDLFRFVHEKVTESCH